MGELIGYARVSTSGQDLEPQVESLLKLGVARERIYVDQGFTGKNRQRPGLEKALAAIHDGSTLVVTKLDRLGRDVADLHAIANELQKRGSSLSINGEIHNPSTAAGRLMFNVFAMVAEFEGDIISQRTKEGLALARERGKLKGRKPKLKPSQDEVILTMHEAKHRATELAELFKVSNAGIYRALDRARAARRAVRNPPQPKSSEGG